MNQNKKTNFTKQKNASLEILPNTSLMNHPTIQCNIFYPLTASRNKLQDTHAPFLCEPITCQKVDWLVVLTPRPPGSSHMGFVVDNVALGQIFSEYFGFPCQFAFRRFLYSRHHHLSSGAGITGQTMAAVPSGLSLTP
jgi:hypothetical protein